MLLMKINDNPPIHVSQKDQWLVLAASDGTNAFLVCAESFTRNLETVVRNAAYGANRHGNGAKHKSKQGILAYQLALHVEHSNWVRCFGGNEAVNAILGSDLAPMIRRERDRLLPKWQRAYHLYTSVVLQQVTLRCMRARSLDAEGLSGYRAHYTPGPES